MLILRLRAIEGMEDTKINQQEETITVFTFDHTYLTS